MPRRATRTTPCWIIKNQFGRRNLPIYVRGTLALRMKAVIEAKAREKQKEAGEQRAAASARDENGQLLTNSSKASDAETVLTPPDGSALTAVMSAEPTPLLVETIKLHDEVTAGQPSRDWRDDPLEHTPPQHGFVRPKSLD